MLKPKIEQHNLYRRGEDTQMSMWFFRGGCQMSMFVYKGGGRGQKWAKICLRGLWKPPYDVNSEAPLLFIISIFEYIY